MRSLLPVVLLLLSLQWLWPPPASSAEPPHVLTPATRAAWPHEAHAGNPWANYGRWVIGADVDPAWFKMRSVTSCYMAWLATGEQKYLDLATDEYLLMPDVSDGQPVVHLGEIGHAADYLVLKPHLTEARRAEWERRLKALGDKMLTHVRVGDFDQCLTYALYWKILDKYLGSDYQSHPKVAEVSKYLADYMQPARFAGGPYDASSGYEQSTSGQLLWGAAILGKDCFAWFDAWAKQYREFLLASVSADLQVAAQWGDLQGADNGKVTAWHRIQVCCLLAGLGYDADDRLKSLAMGMIWKPIGANPGDVYPYGGMGFSFVCSPAELIKAKPAPLPDAFHVGAGVGITVLRSGDSFAQAYLANTADVNGVWTADDHHYAGAWAHASWYRGGEWLLPVPPGRYSIGHGVWSGDGGNEWYNHNAVAMKHQGWFWDKRFEGAERTATGFVARGSMRGPSAKWSHNEAGKLVPPGAKDFDGCLIESAIEFDGESFTWRDKWTAPGDTFPAWSAHMPTFQRCLHANGEPKEIAGGYEWTTPKGTKMRVAVTGHESMEAMPKPHQAGLWVMYFRSSKNSGTMTVRVSDPSLAPDPPPPLPPTPNPPPPPLPPGPEPRLYLPGRIELRQYPDRIERVEIFPRAP